MLSRKYEPSSISEMIANRENARRVKELIKKGRPVLIHGRPGVGKTLTARLVARELDYDLILLSSDETRTARAMEKIRNAWKEGSLFRKGKLFVVDDADRIESVDWIVDMVKQGARIIVICNDLYNSKLWKISKMFEVVKYSAARKDSILSLLKRIAEREGITVDSKTLAIIAASSNGDVRAAINSLESLSHDYRDYRIDIFKTIGIIFKSSFSSAYQAIMESEKDVDEITLWLSQNIPEEYERLEEVERAYACLSKADMWRRQVSEGDWTIMPLVTAMVAAVSAAKERPYRKFTKYRPPARFYRSQQMSFIHMSSRKLMSDRLMKRLIQEYQSSDGGQ